MTEAELAAHVVADLESQHADVYQEVQMTTGSGIADIVAQTGPVATTPALSQAPSPRAGVSDPAGGTGALGEEAGPVRGVS